MHHLKKVVSDLQRSCCFRDAYSGVMPFPVKSQVSVTVVQLGIDRLTFTNTKNTGVNMRGASLEGGDGVPEEHVSREPFPNRAEGAVLRDCAASVVVEMRLY